MNNHFNSKLFIFDKKKFIVGCILAIINFYICSTLYSWKAGIVFAGCFIVIGAIRIISDKHSSFLEVAYCILSIVGTCFISQFLLETGVFWKLEPVKLVLELICSTILFLFIYTLSLNPRFSAYISSFILVLLSLANYYVVKFRGNELVPADFASAKTALNVASEYDFSLNAMTFYGLVLYGLFLFSSFMFSWAKNIKISKKSRRTWCIIFEFLLVIVWYLGCSNIKIETWCMDGSFLNGYFVNFSAQLIEQLHSKKPENYSLDIISEYENKYKSPNTSSLEDLPNVIIIMDESFADLNILGSELNTSEPVTPFYDSLQNNTIKGYALSSVYGGGTANSEYEVLTGNSVGFITEGATAYQLYLNSPSYSIAQTFNNLGYSCVATHPYYSSGWSRTRAWPYLGFNEISFLEDYPQENMVRDYVSDQEMFEYIVREYESKSTSEKLFLFGVTMQNHGGYEYTDSGYTPNISLEGYNNSYPDVEQYLGLIHETDKALEYLINYFESAVEDVVILFFGDHLPRLNQSFYEEVHDGSFDTLAEQQLQYTVPFFVWANYDIPEETIEITSLNYLSNYVYQVAGIEFPAYNQFLADTAEIVPALNAFGYYSVEQGDYLKYENAKSEEKNVLDSYEILQYNAVFENDESRSQILFPIS